METRDEDMEPKLNKEGPWARRAARAWTLLRLGFAWCWKSTRTLLGRGRVLVSASWRHPRTQALRARLQREGARLGGAIRMRLPLLRRASRLALGAAAGLLLIVGSVWIVGRFCLHTVEPGEVGVRYSKWNGDGVVRQDFGPGLHLSLPGVHEWYSLPSGTELLTWRLENGEKPGNQLDVRTQDGTSISLTLTVPYRVQQGGAHRIVFEGHRNTYRAQALAKTEQVLLNEFGRLNTEEFSRSEVRRDLLDEALTLLNASLAEIHVQAEEILIDELRFSSAYEKKLVETQRARQRGRVLQARQLEDQEQQTILRRRHEIDQELLARRIELDREIESIRDEGQALAVESARAVAKFESDMRADADREYELLVAQGQAEVLRAQELGRRLHAENLSGAGGEQHLALQAVRATRLEEVVLNTNDPRVPNPLDVEAMIGLFASKESP